MIFRIILERHCFKAICGGSSKVKISWLVFTHDESSAWGQMNTIWTHHFVMALKQHNYAFKILSILLILSDDSSSFPLRLK